MSAHQAWNVYNQGKRIDTVFYNPTCDADYVRRGLVDHDGYPSTITVRRCNKYSGMQGKKTVRP